MFDPQNVQPGEPPVPPEYWLQGIVIDLSPVGSWAERSDLYRSSSNPNGLDPARWRATDAQYHASILWDMQGDTDFRVDGQQNFVVINDLTRSAGERGKFVLFLWQDLGSTMPSEEQVSWSRIKKLYR